MNATVCGGANIGSAPAPSAAASVTVAAHVRPWVEAVDGPDGGDRGCRVVSAGTDDHSSTNFMATPSIIRFFETGLPIT